MVLTLKCVFMLIVSVTRNYFRSRFFRLFERQNTGPCAHKWWKKCLLLNMCCVCKNTLLFCNLVFLV